MFKIIKPPPTKQTTTSDTYMAENSGSPGIRVFTWRIGHVAAIKYEILRFVIQPTLMMLTSTFYRTGILTLQNRIARSHGMQATTPPRNMLCVLDRRFITKNGTGIQRFTMIQPKLMMLTSTFYHTGIPTLQNRIARSHGTHGMQATTPPRNMLCVLDRWFITKNGTGIQRFTMIQPKLMMLTSTFYHTEILTLQNRIVRSHDMQVTTPPRNMLCVLDRRFITKNGTRIQRFTMIQPKLLMITTTFYRTKLSLPLTR